MLRTAAAGLLAGLAGCGERTETPTATPEGGPSPPTTTPSEYETVVDLVEEGADPNGERSIRPLLEEYTDDDTLLYLREGRFLLSGIWNIEGISNLALVGDHATLVPAEGDDTVQINAIDSRDIAVEGLHFDYTNPEVDGRALQLKVSDGLLVSNISVAGQIDRGGGPVRVDVTDPDGKGVVERVSIPDGSGESRVTGMYVGDNNHGEIVFRDCHVEGFSDNGLYADPPAGRIVVEGGYYANCGISNVRIKSGSVVRGAHIRCDEPHPEFENMRGIRVTDYEPRPDAEPSLVEDCRVELLDVTHSDGAIVLSSKLARLTVRNSRIRVNADGINAIRAKVPDPTVAEGSTPPRLDCDNVTVTGSAANDSAIRIDERHGCVLDGLYVHQPGEDRDGIEFRRSTDNVVTNSVLDVAGQAVRLVNSTANVDASVSTNRRDGLQRW